MDAYEQEQADRAALLAHVRSDDPENDPEVKAAFAARVEASPSVSDEMIDKANRLLTDGAVRVAIEGASVRGDTGHYRIERHGPGLYTCDCPARGLCAHLLAISLITGSWAES